MPLVQRANYFFANRQGPYDPGQRSHGKGRRHLLPNDQRPRFALGNVLWRSAIQKKGQSGMNYVYITIRDKETVEYHVGFYDSLGAWHGESKFNGSESAASRVNYLNGGTGDAPRMLARILDQLRFLKR
jgi:hypothetical protein